MKTVKYNLHLFTPRHLLIRKLFINSFVYRCDMLYDLNGIDILIYYQFKEDLEL